MTTAPKAEKAVKVLDSQTQANYAEVLMAKENSNAANFEFLAYVAGCLNSKKLSQVILEDSIKAESKGATITAEFKAGSVKYAVIAQAIVDAFPEVLFAPVAKVLTMAGRVGDDVKAKNALAHIKKFDTFADLDEGTLTKAESQARDKGESLSNEIEDKKENINNLSVVASFVEFFKGKNLADLRLESHDTESLKLIKNAVSICIALDKNTQATIKSA